MPRPTIDRIDSAKGYVKGNIQWIDKDINRIKLNLTDTEFIEWCKIVTHPKPIIEKNILKKLSEPILIFDKIKKESRHKKTDIESIIHKRFGLLTVIKFDKCEKNKYYLCDCACGNKNHRVHRGNLISKHVQSCGCLRKKKGINSKYWVGYEHLSRGVFNGSSHKKTYGFVWHFENGI